MIERQYGKLVIVCDTCGEGFEGASYQDEFADIWGSAKREGWRARKIGNEWLHGCPKCGV